MKIDLCKLLGVEEGEEFKIKFKVTEKYEVINKYRFKNGNLEFYNDCIDKWQDSAIEFNTVLNSEIIKKLPKKKEFSQDTLNFFKRIDKEYKWIAKDESGDVCVYREKPTKDRRFWCYNDGIYNIYNMCYISKAINQDIFNQILWEDEEPVYIDDYVDRK